MDTDLFVRLVSVRPMPAPGSAGTVMLEQVSNSSVCRPAGRLLQLCNGRFGGLESVPFVLLWDGQSRTPVPVRNGAPPKGRYRLPEPVQTGATSVIVCESLIATMVAGRNDNV
jgi:hypothetical protein